MTSMRAVVVAGLAAAAATGLATPAWAAPAKPTAPAPTAKAAKTAKPAKAPVTTDQCAAANGRVQRAKDGVGTCVGGKDDGHLIKDVTTRRADGSTAAPTRYGSSYDDNFPGFGSNDSRRDPDRRYSDDQRYGSRPGMQDDRGTDRGTDRGYDRGTDRGTDRGGYDRPTDRPSDSDY